MMKKIPLSIFAVCLLLSGCKNSVNSYPVTFVRRSDVFPLEAGMQKSNPLTLVVEIDKNGRLRLNKIETGTISDISVLNEKLKAIFDDRAKASIREREIFVDPQGEIEKADFERLIEILASVKASPIRVIKNDF